MSNTFSLLVKKLNPKAQISRATEHSAGLDLYTVEPFVIQPQTILLASTGISVAIPENYVGKLYIRSSVALKKGLTLANSVGVIDADYRGEIQIPLYNMGCLPVTINAGERIAQLLIEPIIYPLLHFVDELPETDRGTGGFGSTGQ